MEWQAVCLNLSTVDRLNMATMGLFSLSTVVMSGLSTVDMLNMATIDRCDLCDPGGVPFHPCVWVNREEYGCAAPAQPAGWDRF